MLVSLFRKVEFVDFRRRAIEVAVSDPRWARSHIHKAWPALSVAFLRERAEVDILEMSQLGATGKIRYALILCGTFVTDVPIANDECNLGVTSQIDDPSGDVERVEDNLQIVGQRDANERSLWRTCS
ncbi:MAG TPA: hypothetical protein VIL70_04380 [Chthoniobacterales bacterium]